MPRPRIVLALAAAFLPTATACSSPSAGGVTSTPARDRLATIVRQLMDANGVPVEDYYIGCSGSLDRHSDTCAGLTATEPEQRITGSFRSGAAGGGGDGCPGTLIITVGPPVGYLDSSGPVHPLTDASEDPCR
jgi:hypothetical protein